LDAPDPVGREEHPVVAAEEPALVDGGDVDPVATGLEGVGDLGRVNADVVVVVDARQRMHAVGPERNRRGRVGGRAAERALERDEAPLDERVVARANVVARQAGVGAHRTALLRRDVPVAIHLGQHEAGDTVLLAVAGSADALAIVGGDIDGGARHQLARRVLDELDRDRPGHGLGSRLAYYIDGACARAPRSRCGASPHAQYAASSPPAPSATKAQPHTTGAGPGAFVRSRIRPNAMGAIAPAPKPRNERSASAAPRCEAPTVSVRA